MPAAGRVELLTAIISTPLGAELVLSPHSAKYRSGPSFLLYVCAYCLGIRHSGAGLELFSPPISFGTSASKNQHCLAISDYT